MKTIALAGLIALGILSVSTVLAAPHEAAGTPFTLLCRATVNNQLFTKNLEIDYGAKKVDGVRAVITDTMITWSSKELDPYRKTNVVVQHELNRLAGNYRSWSEGAIYASPPPSYACEKAPQPKF